MAENQSRFREANEKIEATATTVGFVGEIPFLCECSDEACRTVISLGFEAYEAVRQHPRLFFTAPGHEVLSVESGGAVVTERNSGFVVLEKIEAAGEVAEERYGELEGRGEGE